MKPQAQAYRSLNKHLTFFGCIDRQYFLMGLFAAAGVFGVVHSVMFALFAAGLFFVAGYFHAKDPVMLRLLFAADKCGKPVYDPALRKPFIVIIIEDTENL